MANTWWIVVPSLSERNVQATPKDAIIAEVSDTSHQYQVWLNTDNGGAVYNGKTYYRRMGPFTSLKDAQNAFKTGATNANTQIPGVQITPGGGLTTTNPLTGLDAIGAFFNALTQANTWIRVAKVVAGGVLLVVGLVHITGAAGATANLARKVPLPI